MTTEFDQYCRDCADACIAEYRGQLHFQLLLAKVPQIDGDPTAVVAAVESLIMEQLPEVHADAHIDGFGRMDVKLRRRTV